MNRAHQCSGSATGPLIVSEPCNNVTTRGQVSLLSNPIITQKDWYTPPLGWKHHKKWYPSVLIHPDSFSLPTPTSKYILSRLSQFVPWLKLITCVCLFSQTFIKMQWHLNPASWWEMNKDLLKCMSSQESAGCRLSFGLVTERLSAAHSTPRPLTPFTPSEWVKTRNRSQDGQKLRPCSNTGVFFLLLLCFLLLLYFWGAEGNGPFPSARPT